MAAVGVEELDCVGDVPGLEVDVGSLLLVGGDLVLFSFGA